MAFPVELSNILPGVTEIIAAHINNLEAKVGIDNSAVATTLDYLLKNPASIDPGHKHSKLWASDGSATAMTVTATGKVGIGTTSPGATLEVNKNVGSYEPLAFFGNSSMSNGDYLVLSIGQSVAVNSGFHLVYQHDSTETSRRFIIGTMEGWSSGEGITLLGNGNVGIWTMSPGYKLTCNGEPGANGYTAWTNYSDIRFKQDITSLNNNILAKILKLNPVTFSYNDKNPWNEKPGERLLYGFIAQELQEIFPDMVGEAKGPDGEKYLTTNLSNLTLYLVQAIKEQQTQIETLQAKLK